MGCALKRSLADIAGDGDAAPELLSINPYDIAVLDRDIPGPPVTRSPNASSPAVGRYADPVAYGRRPA